jgi:hypothetical protein
LALIQPIDIDNSAESVEVAERRRLRSLQTEPSAFVVTHQNKKPLIGMIQLLHMERGLHAQWQT